MEQISGVIATKFTTYLNKDQHWCNIFQYAVQVLLEKWISLTVMGILAGSFGYGKEYILFLLVFMPLRAYCGGFHMKTYAGCLVCSCLVVASVLVTSRAISVGSNVWYIGISAIVLLLFPMNRMAPVLHSNRPMKQKEIDMCRKKLKLLTVILTGVILFFSACGMGWIVTLLSETVWIVLIFMFLGKMEYEKEIQKKAK